LRALEGARAALSDGKERTRELRIATFEVFSTHFLSWMLQNRSMEDPLTALEMTPGNIEKGILGGAVDFGLTYIPVLHPDLDHVVAGEMPLGVFTAQHARNIDLPFAVPVTDTGVNAMQISSLDGWPSDAHRVIRFRFEMLETALDLASRGGCRILCPKFIVRIENERLNQKHCLVEVPQKVRFPKLKVYAIKKKSRTEDVRFRSLCKAIRIALREP
jgi:DNA-binding transcriptional LysR family regulator